MTYTTVDTNAVTGKVTVREWTAEEVEARKVRLTPLAWNSLRRERNQKLVESDIYVAMDRWDTYTLGQKRDWREYRQALRDLPNTTVDPFNPVWPSKPA